MNYCSIEDAWKDSDYISNQYTLYDSNQNNYDIKESFENNDNLIQSSAKIPIQTPVSISNSNPNLNNKHKHTQHHNHNHHNRNKHISCDDILHHYHTCNYCKKHLRNIL